MKRGRQPNRKLKKATARDRLDFVVRLPGGDTIETVGEAFAYIERLPKATQRRPEWQAAVGYLHRAVTEQNAWLWFARSSLARAIHGDAPAPIKPPRTKKAERWKERRKAR